MVKSRRRAKPNNTELDSVYLLKLVLYMVLGVQWLRIYPTTDVFIPLPIGALIALMFAGHDHFAIDRKIEYAVILIAMFVGFWLPIGLDISI